MDRSGLQTSRALIVALVLLVCVGLIVKIHRLSGARSQAVATASPGASSAKPAAAVPTPATSDGPAPIKPILTSTTDLLAATYTTPAAKDSGTGNRVDASNARPAAWSQLLDTGTPAATVTPAPAPVISTGKGPIADGQTLAASGDLVQARQVLNAAWLSGTLSATDQAAAKSLLSSINQTLVFSPKVMDNDPFASSHPVAKGEALARIATGFDTTWDLLAQINNVDPKKLRAGQSIKVIHGPFYAWVDKKAFTMDIYLGGLPPDSSAMYVTTFQVGLGREDSTPTGTWAIGPHAKLKHPNYYPPEGGKMIAADDPANPLGGFWIALTGIDGDALGKKSYGIHGTIDPDSIGHQSSMGCIRLRSADITQVFALLVEGKSRVVVKE